MSEEEQEVWKSYPDIPFIEASNLGRVRTKDRTVTRSDGIKLHIKGRVLEQQLQRSGYMFVGFRVNGKYVTLSVHRIVATCFLPNPGNLPEVNHIDCDPTNNRLDNLEWCTRQENISYRDKLGHMANNNPGHPVIAIDLSGLKVFWFESQREAERQLGINHSNICRVIKGLYDKTKGFWFCNADENAVEKVRSKFGDDIAEKVEKLINENKKF